LFGFWSFYNTVDPLGLTGIGIISWVGYAPTLAASGVQSRYSPYAAMGNNPAILVDPDGLKFAYPVLLTGRAEHSRVIAAMEAEVEYKQNGRLTDMSRHLSVGGIDWADGLILFGWMYQNNLQ